MAYDVIVTIEEVRAITSDIDSASAPDMYAKLKIGRNGQWHKTGHREDRRHVFPNWTHRARFEDNEIRTITDVTVEVQLWDEDTIFDPDDRIDINPSEGMKSIKLFLYFDAEAARNGEFTAGILFLPHADSSSDPGERLPGGELNRVADGNTHYWQTGRLYSAGCGDDRAELWYRVRVEEA